ncbi:MAG: preprotein translocase subunit SecG [Myxococcota bacterium]|nr:preprotein translocase subunit SecG [Myxococcota bacterium]
MSTFLTILHVVICFVLIAVVLLQSGREGGGDIGGGGGGGGKPVQSGNAFMERLTSTMAVFFMITSIVLAAQGAGSSVMAGEAQDAPAGVTAPAENSETELGNGAEKEASEAVPNEAAKEDKTAAPAEEAKENSKEESKE